MQRWGKQSEIEQFRLKEIKIVDELVDAMANMKETEALILAEKKLNQGENPLKVLELCREAVQYSGADAYGQDAVAAVALSKKWVENIHTAPSD